MDAAVASRAATGPRPVVVVPRGRLRGRWQLLPADAVVEGVYSVPVINHVCLEPHGVCVAWDDAKEKVTSWASTQSVMGTANELSQRLTVPAGNVTVITEVMVT